MKEKVIIEDIEQARMLAKKFDEKVNEMYKRADSPQNRSKFESMQAGLLQPDSKTKGKLDNTLALLDKSEHHKFVRTVAHLQRKWRAIRVKDTLTAYNSNGFHNHPVNVFVNNQNIDINLNVLKQEALLTAYREKNWQSEIFSDSLLLQTALGLFSSGKLQHTEFETLLKMKYESQPTAYTILDENNNFTEYANTYLIANLCKSRLYGSSKGFMHQRFHGTKLNNFKLLLRAFFEMYPSENVFFTSDIQPSDKLAKTLYGLLSIIRVGEKKITLSCIVENALQLACFPIEDVVPVRSIAGNLSIRDIERFIDVGLRPGAVSFHGVPCNENVHNYKKVPDATKREHDFYHGRLMSEIGVPIRNAYSRIKDLSRFKILQYCTNLQDQDKLTFFSKATWALIDLDFPSAHFFKENLTKNFCEGLLFTPSTPILFTLETRGCTDLGIITFIDMVENASLWQDDFKIDLEQMTSEFKEPLNIARKLYPYFKKDNSKYNIFIFRMYEKFGEAIFNKVIEFLVRYDALLQSEDKVLECLEFRRNNKIGFLGLVNRSIEGEVDNKYRLALTLLQMGSETLTIPKTFDFYNNGDFLVNLLNIKLYFHHNEAIQKQVYELLTQVVQSNSVTNLEGLNAFITELQLFLKEEKNNSESLIKENLDVLASVIVKLSNMNPCHQHEFRF